MKATYKSGNYSYSTLTRSNYMYSSLFNLDSCNDVCNYYENLYASLNSAYSSSTSKYTLNYFRCYITENGNNDNADDLPSGEETDVVCTARMHTILNGL